jgi:hypothetical protein
MVQCLEEVQTVQVVQDVQIVEDRKPGYDLEELTIAIHSSQRF